MKNCTSEKREKERMFNFFFKSLHFVYFHFLTGDSFNYSGKRVYADGALASPALACWNTEPLHIPIISYHQDGMAVFGKKSGGGKKEN